jgi:hypothetical protein
MHINKNHVLFMEPVPAESQIGKLHQMALFFLFILNGINTIHAQRQTSIPHLIFCGHSKELDNNFDVFIIPADSGNK